MTMTTPNTAPLDPQGAPPAMTPADSPSNPAGYAGVTPGGQGPASYDIQAPPADLTGVFNAANSLTGTGFLYPQGPRQAAAEMMMDSPGGFGSDGFDVTDGFHEGGGGGWPNDVEPDVAGP